MRRPGIRTRGLTIRLKTSTLLTAACAGMRRDGGAASRLGP
jgi:hypothetical protein